MKALKIMAAHSNAAITSTSGSGIANSAALLTPDPREVAAYSAGASSVVIDLGEPKISDTFFVGYNTFGQGDYCSISVSNDPSFATFTAAYIGAVGDNALSVTPVAASPRNRLGVIQTNPAIGRYVKLDVTNVAAATLGVLAAGNSFTARWGAEMGAGRPLLDRSTVEALPLGGFGIDPGAITGGYQWTFGDLQQSEIAALYRLIASVGQSRSVLVIEDPDFLYDTPTIIGSAALSGNNKIVTKTGGGTGYNAGAGFPLRDGAATGMSFKASYVTGGRLTGFWPQANGAGTYSYAIETSGNNITRYTPAGGVLIGSYVANDRFSVKYEEGLQRFATLQNGVIIDAYPASTALPLYPAALLYAPSGPADKLEELNVFGLGYEDRIHWGLLGKLDAYERLDPQNTKWSLSIGDWA